ncbi:MAG: hypothetical protein ACPGU5_05535 [Lishizhenia sp.]
MAVDLFPEKAEDKKVEDKTVGVLAYCTFIGFIVALFLNSKKEGTNKRFGAFHLRQGLGFLIVALLFFILFTVLSSIFEFVFPKEAVAIIIGSAFCILMIIQIIAASNGEFKEMPIVGKITTKIFGAIY